MEPKMKGGSFDGKAQKMQACLLQAPDHAVLSGRRGINGMYFLTLDEYEAIRLIDYQGLSQEQCAGQMGVARTTVQQIYADARRKLAAMLVEGLPLKIEGGDYQLCDGSDCFCGFENCFKHPAIKYFRYRKEIIR